MCKTVTLKITMLRSLIFLRLRNHSAPNHTIRLSSETSYPTMRAKLRKRMHKKLKLLREG